MKGHEWEATIYNRTLAKTGCKRCSNDGSSFMEYAIMYTLDTNNVKYIHRHILEGLEVDIYLPEFDVSIEYNGSFFHELKREDDIKKFNKLHELCEKLILVNENGLSGFECLKLENIVQLYNVNDNRKRDFSFMKDIFKVLGMEDYKYFDYSEEMYKNIIVFRDIKITRNSLLNDLLLMKEWNYVKNKEIKPEYFTVGSDVSVWWVCYKGHEWKSSIGSRTSKARVGCPYCSNKKIGIDNNLLFTNEVLCEEWDYDKNGELLPVHVSKGSGKKVAWKCSEGHEWYARICNRARTKGSGCPKCRKRVR